MAPNAPKFQSSMRFTSFGASTTGTSNHEGGKRSSNTNNAHAHKPKAAPYFNDVSSYPPLPAPSKKRGSAVQAVQEAAAAASRLEHQNQADAQSRHGDQDQHHTSDGPQCDGPSASTKEQPVPRHPPKLMEGAKLQLRCAALEQQLQHQQAQATHQNNHVHASLLQLLDVLKLQGFEVAAALDSLQDDLCEDEGEGSEEPGSEQPCAHHASTHHTSTSAANESTQLPNGISSAQAHNAHAHDTHAHDAHAHEAQAHEARMSSAERGQPSAAPHPAASCSAPQGSPAEPLTRPSQPDAASSGRPAPSEQQQQQQQLEQQQQRLQRGGRGALEALSAGLRCPPEKLVMLRAKRDHLEMEFIELMRTSVMGLERLLTAVQAQH